MRKFTISDLHFGHKNILTYEKIRKDLFGDSVEKMNEYLIEKWNKTVDPEDHVYYVGDFSFSNNSLTKELISKLNGHIHLIMGNHDFQVSPTKFLSMGIRSVQMESIIRLSKQVMIKLNHFPYSGDSDSEKGRYEMFRPVKQDGIWLVHGHMHSKGIKIDYEQKSICVSGELWKFTPINLDHILAIINKSEGTNG